MGYESTQGAWLILIFDTTPPNYEQDPLKMSNDVSFIVQSRNNTFDGLRPLQPMIFADTNSVRDMTTEVPRAVVCWFIDLAQANR